MLGTHKHPNRPHRASQWPAGCTPSLWPLARGHFAVQESGELPPPQRSEGQGPVSGHRAGDSRPCESSSGSCTPRGSWSMLCGSFCVWLPKGPSFPPLAFLPSQDGERCGGPAPAPILILLPKLAQHSHTEAWGRAPPDQRPLEAGVRPTWQQEEPGQNQDSWFVLLSIRTPKRVG